MASLTLGKKTCSSCYLEIGKNHKNISCVTCGGCFHARAACLKSPLKCQQTEIDTCDMCLTYSLPFHQIDDDEFEFIFGDFTRFPKDEDMDRLKRLKFNPFSFSTDINSKTEYFLSENFECQDCNYYLPSDFPHFDDKDMSIINLNIRSLANKFDTFKNLLDTLKQRFSIISLTETWLNEHKSVENFGLTDYYFVCSNRINRRGGGLGIYVSNNFNFKRRPDLDIIEDGIIETLFIEIISTSGKNIIVGTVYRPPSGNFDMFENKFNEILTKVDKSNKITYLMGDFNIDLLKTENSDYSSRFCEQLFTSSFFPLITRPSRITQHTATLIDNIFTNDLAQLDSGINGIIFFDISDHLPIFHLTATKTKNNSKPIHTQYKRTVNKKSLASFLSYVKNISWSNTFQTHDPCESYSIFHNNLQVAINKSFPLVKTNPKNDRSVNHAKSPWLTSGILKSISKKNQLYKKFLKKPSSRIETNYKKYKNKLNHLIKIAKKNITKINFPNTKTI